MSRLLSGLAIFTLLFFNPVYAQQSVTKEFCLTAVNHDSIDALKQNLLNGAKRQAINELFGELITSMSRVEKFELTEDMISTYSSGFVRVKGDPQFRNGTGLAEVCARIQAYVTAEDLTKLKPVRIERKNCHADANLTTGALKKVTKDKAIMSALLDYDRRLEGVEPKHLVPLIHQIRNLKSGFVPDSETYCSHIQGTIMPVEVVTLIQNKRRYLPSVPLIVNLADSAFSASSFWANDLKGHGPPNARYDRVNTFSNWSSGANNPHQWLQIDLGGPMEVRAVASKGRSKGVLQWVTRYRLAYSMDGANWTSYKQNGVVVDFPGNNDTNTGVKHDLPEPVQARYLRFLPQAWHAHITMRAEAFGTPLQ